MYELNAAGFPFERWICPRCLPTELCLGHFVFDRPLHGVGIPAHLMSWSSLQFPERLPESVVIDGMVLKLMGSSPGV